MKTLTIIITLILSFNLLARKCDPIDSGLLSSDLDTQRSQLQDAWDDCPHLTTAVQLAKVFQRLGDTDIADEVMLDALNEVVKNNQDRTNWLIANTEMALSNNQTCKASKHLNELSTFKESQNTYQQLRIKLYESTQNQVMDSKTIACALTAQRSITIRGRKVSQKLDLAIHFSFNSDVLTQQGRAQAQQLAKVLTQRQNKSKQLNLIGHTDKVGDSDYNQNLSQRRSQAVKTYLIQLNDTLRYKINATGMGESQLLSYGDTDQDHRLNRRVEIQLN